MKKQVKNGVIKVLILVLILAGAYGLWCHFLTDNVIWKKLKINGIAIQGMTKEEAIDAISKDFQEKYANTQMTITLNGKNFKVSIYPVLGLDVKSIVESAYALGHGAWFTHGIQIGIEPKRLLKELKQNEISAVVSDMPVYKGIEIFVADSQTKIVKGATDSRQIGVKLEGLVVSSDKKSGETDVRLIRIGGKRCKCLLSQYDDYIVAVTIDSSFYRQGNIFAVLIVGVYLVLASCCMFYMLSRVMKEKYEKEKLLYISNTDELTRCFNRHAYEERINNLDLREEWIYISMDLNNLKHTNDSLGHAAGDELICAAADCMRESFGNYGNVYRIGGDEFVVIITGNTKEFQSIIESFDRSVAQWHGKLVDSMTISWGYVFSSEKEWDNIYDIAKEADARMYKNKERYYQERNIVRRR